MQGANFWEAQMQEARMMGADLSRSTLTGMPDSPNPLTRTNLTAATNHGGALRFVDLTMIEFDAATDFRNAFLDASVALPDGFRDQMSGGKSGEPCQWHPEELSDDEFHARWRGWLEVRPFWDSWVLYAPEAYRNIKPIPPDPGCEWKTGPMPGTE
ncbi:MAG: hypothetical protein GY717_18210 [Rhodobacteraceae bacterium]|nr:hypothetical protein [Paracoccaceae bacterium]